MVFRGRGHARARHAAAVVALICLTLAGCHSGNDTSGGAAALAAAPAGSSAPTATSPLQTPSTGSAPPANSSTPSATATGSAPPAAPSPTTGSGGSSNPQGGTARATLHYAPNGNFDSHGNYLPLADGFNLADVSDVATLSALPAGVVGLVWIGQCAGVDAKFIATIQPYIGNPNLFGFYLMDEPDPTGQYAPRCPASNLLAESDWIHANVPGAKTFIVMLNLGTPQQPNYDNTYTPGNTHIDLFGLDPYPVRPASDGGIDYTVIAAAVHAAQATGIPVASMVPVFQTFGGGGYSSWALPTAAQEQQILSTWAALLPNPVFDYAYSWGAQNGDQALSTSSALQQVLLLNNTMPFP